MVCWSAIAKVRLNRALPFRITHNSLLARKGRLSASLLPRERRAAQWILELRAGDALLEGAPQQAIARALFRRAIAPDRWRIESASYRLRVQRLVRVARRYLAAPLSGPWFD